MWNGVIKMEIIIKAIFFISWCLNNLIDFIIEVNKIENFTESILEFEITFLSILFIFLPIIIDHKSEKYYLGYKISEWILYKRKKGGLFNFLNKLFLKGKNINDITKTWIIELLIIIITIVNWIIGPNIISLFLFLIFIFILSHKVREYMKISSSDEYLKEIEIDFLMQASNNPSDVINELEQCKMSADLKTFEFLVSNYKDSMSKLYFHMYNSIMRSGNSEKIESLFEIVKNNSDKVEYLYIDDWDIRHFVEKMLNKKNAEKTYYCISYLVDKELSKNLKTNQESSLFTAVYTGLYYNKNFDNSERVMYLKDILKEFRRLIITQKVSSDSQITRYKMIFTVFKCAIEIGDINGAIFVIKSMNNSHIYHSSENHILFIAMFIYLYYLIELEGTPYIQESEKKNLESVYDEIKKSIKSEYIFDCNEYDVRELFKFVDMISYNWEKFYFNDYEDTCFKNSVSHNAIRNAKKALYIYSVYTNIRNVEEEDLKLFYGCIINNKLNDDDCSKICHIYELLNIRYQNDIFDKYITNLINFCTEKEYKSINSLNISEYNKKVSKYNEEATRLTSSSNLANSTNSKSSQNEVFQTLVSVDSLSYHLENDFLEWADAKTVFEEIVVKRISSRKLKKINYRLGTEAIMLNKMKQLRKQYHYIVQDVDWLREDSRYKKEYNNATSKFHVHKVHVNDCRILIDKFNCTFTSVKFSVRKLTQKEISKEISFYKCGSEYKINIKYGIEVLLSEDQIRKYIENNYVMFEMKFEYSINVKGSNGYMFTSRLENKDDNN